VAELLLGKAVNSARFLLFAQMAGVLRHLAAHVCAMLAREILAPFSFKGAFFYAFFALKE
jgi:hypothetical protein